RILAEETGKPGLLCRVRALLHLHTCPVWLAALPGTVLTDSERDAVGTVFQHVPHAADVVGGEDVHARVIDEVHVVLGHRWPTVACNRGCVTAVRRAAYRWGVVAVVIRLATAVAPRVQEAQVVPDLVRQGAA